MINFTSFLFEYFWFLSTGYHQSIWRMKLSEFYKSLDTSLKKRVREKEKVRKTESERESESVI